MMLIIIWIDFKFIIQLSLNSSYVVREISETSRLEGLIGIEEIITNDYESVFYVLLINSLTLLFVIARIIVIKFFKNRDFSIDEYPQNN